MRKSTQHILDRVRKPRVHITYDVEIDNAKETKELPYVIGVLSNLSLESSTYLKDRQFIEIDLYNFNDVMTFLSPKLTLLLTNDSSETKNKETIQTIINLKTMDDFSPIGILQQIPHLKKIYDSRLYLKDILLKMAINGKLNTVLREIFKYPEKFAQLKKEFGIKESEIEEYPKKYSTEITEGSMLEMGIGLDSEKNE